jgi:putative glutamine amidotransferase
MKPVIGIPQCLDDVGRIRAGRRYLYGDIAYSDAVDRAGGLALQLPIQSDPEALVAQIDALMLPGGDDFAPESPYPAEVRFDLAPEEQVSFDRRLLEAALQRGIPVLGICYGAQLIALHHGGTLHHHLPIDLPESTNHRLGDTGAVHEVRLEPGSRIAAIFGKPTIAVNSLHHQAVADPGRRLRIRGRCPDGVTEAIEASEGFCIGVQWHPEKMPGTEQESLFHALVNAATQSTGA